MKVDATSLTMMIASRRYVVDNRSGRGAHKGLECRRHDVRGICILPRASGTGRQKRRDNGGMIKREKAG